MQQAVISTLEGLNYSTLPSISNNFNSFLSTSYFDAAFQNFANTTSEFIAYSPITNRSVTLAAAIQQSNTTITTTSSHFVSFLVLLPWGVKYSNSPEVQVVLASIPILIIGFAGVLISGFQFSIGRISRPFIDLSICTFAALLAGIFELTNVLVAEFQGSEFLGRGLLISEGLSMAAFISFKFMFLYHQSQQPSIHESIRRDSIILVKSPSKEFNTPTATSNRRSQFHSATYERFGSLGRFTKSIVCASILVVSLLEFVWRFGSTSRFQSFITIYKASGILEIVLFSFFIFKFTLNAYFVERTPRISNFIEIFPYLLGIIFGLLNNILGLLPGFILLTESPLGRFLSMVEVYIFLLTATIEDYRKPFDESLLSDNELLLPSILPRYITSPRPESPSLPERIIVRRSSRIPSWLPDTLGHQTIARSPRSGARSISGQPGSPIEFDLFYDTEDEYLRPPSALGHINLNVVTYDGRDSLAFPASIHVSESNYRQSTSTNVRAVSVPVPRQERSNTHTRDIAVARYDKKGIRLSSPNLDQQFSFVEKRLQLDEAERQLNSIRPQSNRGQNASRTAPRSNSSSPVSSSTTTSFKNLPSLPLPRSLPKNIPVPRGIGIDTSLYTQPLFTRPNLTPTTTTTTTSRKNSDTSAISGFSLSSFPPPPTSLDLTLPYRSSSLGQYQRDVEAEKVHWSIDQRPETSHTNYSRTANVNVVVAEGGVEFEIFSPIQNEITEDEKVENLASRRGLNASNINITSLIVGGASLPNRTSNSFEADELDSPIMPVSPGEISTASIVSRAGSRLAGNKLRLDGTSLGIGGNLLSAGSFSRRILKPFSNENHSRPHLLDQEESYDSTSTQGKSLPRTPSPSSPKEGRYDPNKPFERPRPAPLLLNKIEGVNSNRN